MARFVAAAIQMDSQDNKWENLMEAETYIRRAADAGANLIVLPESMNYIGRDMAGETEELPYGDVVARVSELVGK